MSLKTDFLDGVTGLTQKTQAAFDAGEDLVGTTSGEGEYDTVSDGLKENAALGLTTFTVNVPVTYLPAALRNNKGNNFILKAFLAGVSSGLAASGIFNYECVPALNTTDSVNTSVDLNFTF